MLDVLGEEWDEPEATTRTASRAPAARGSAWRWLAVAAAIDPGRGVALLGRRAVAPRRGRSRPTRRATRPARHARRQGVPPGQLQRGGRTRPAGRARWCCTTASPGKDWNSWGIVLAHAPELRRRGARDASAAATARTARAAARCKFENGEAATWLVTHDDLAGYDRARDHRATTARCSPTPASSPHDPQPPGNYEARAYRVGPSFVEVAGVEPASPGDRLGLLRAEPMTDLTPRCPSAEDLGASPDALSPAGLPNGTGGVSLLR